MNMDNSASMAAAEDPSATLQLKHKRAWIGFLLGAAGPIGFGLFHLYKINLYVTSLASDEYVCGLIYLAPYTLILQVGPVCGVIGATLGWFAPTIGGMLRRLRRMFLALG